MFSFSGRCEKILKFIPFFTNDSFEFLTSNKFRSLFIDLLFVVLLFPFGQSHSAQFASPIFFLLFCAFLSRYILFAVDVTTNFYMPVIHILWISTFFFSYCKKKQRHELFYQRRIIEKWKKTTSAFSIVRMGVVENRCCKVCDMMMQLPSHRRQWLDIRIQYRTIQFDSIRPKRNVIYFFWMNEWEKWISSFYDSLKMYKKKKERKKEMKNRKKTVLLIGIDDVLYSFGNRVSFEIVTH